MPDEVVLVETPAGLGVGGQSSVRHRRDPRTGRTYCGKGTHSLARRRRSLVVSADKCDECFPGKELVADGGGEIEDPDEELRLTRNQAALAALGAVGVGVFIGAIIA